MSECRMPGAHNPRGPVCQWCAAEDAKDSEIARLTAALRGAEGERGRYKEALEQAAIDLHSECSTMKCWEPCIRARDALGKERPQGAKSVPASLKPPAPEGEGFPAQEHPAARGEPDWKARAEVLHAALAGLLRVCWPDQSHVPGTDTIGSDFWVRACESARDALLSRSPNHPNATNTLPEGTQGRGGG